MASLTLNNTITVASKVNKSTEKTPFAEIITIAPTFTKTPIKVFITKITLVRQLFIHLNGILLNGWRKAVKIVTSWTKN